MEVHKNLVGTAKVIEGTLFWTRSMTACGERGGYLVIVDKIDGPVVCCVFVCINVAIRNDPMDAVRLHRCKGLGNICTVGEALEQR